MLGLVLALNYVDRSSLATAAPLIQKEFGLTSAELGLLLSPSSGSTLRRSCWRWLVHRFDVRWVLGLGVLLWGCATALMGLAGGFVPSLHFAISAGAGGMRYLPSIQLIVSRNTGIRAWPSH